MKRSRSDADLTRRRKNIDVATLIREKIVRVGERCSFTYASCEFGAVFGENGAIRDRALDAFFKHAAPNASSCENGVAIYDSPSRWTRDCVHMALNEEDARTGAVIGSSFERNKTVIPAFDKIHTTCTLADDTTREWTLNQARDYHLGEYYGELSSLSSSSSSSETSRDEPAKRARSAQDDDEYVVLGRAAGELSASALSVATVRSITGGRHFKAMAESLQVHLSRSLRVIGGYERVLELVVRDTDSSKPAHRAAVTLLRASSEAVAETIRRRAIKRETAAANRAAIPSSSSSSSSRKRSRRFADSGSTSFDARSLLERVLYSEAIRRDR